MEFRVFKTWNPVPLSPNFYKPSRNSGKISWNTFPLSAFSLLFLGIPSYFCKEIWFLYEFRVIFQMKCGSSMSYPPYFLGIPSYFPNRMWFLYVLSPIMPFLVQNVNFFIFHIFQLPKVRSFHWTMLQNAMLPRFWDIYQSICKSSITIKELYEQKRQFLKNLLFHNYVVKLRS